jgi:hypothetical protein
LSAEIFGRLELEETICLDTLAKFCCLSLSLLILDWLGGFPLLLAASSLFEEAPTD